MTEPLPPPDPRSLIVLPTYNEAGNAIALIREVLSVDPCLSVLVVDDNSPDGTGDLVEAEAASEPRLQLLRRPAKLGLGTAYLAGFRMALDQGFGRAFTMDADGSHHPRYLRAMLEAADTHDMVIGSRYVPGGGIQDWPAHRRWLSAFANLYARSLLRLPVRDVTAGFRCYSREILETVEPFEVRSSGYSFLEEMAWRVHTCGFSICEVPIVFEQRVAGESKIGSSEIYRAAWHVLATAVWPPRLSAARKSGKRAS